MKKFKLSRILVFIIIILAGCKLFVNTNKDFGVQNKIYEYLQDTVNRQKAYMNAAALNNNSTKNTCVYFVSEVLRDNNVDVPNHTSNTTQLIKFLEDRGWNKKYDFKDLKHGDLVFTTDAFGNNDGAPTHVYVFMKWVEEGSYEYAYICDNQAKDYKNKIYHIRNIKNVVEIKGLKKDAFGFFMKP